MHLSDAYSWIKIYEICFELHWSLFLRVVMSYCTHITGLFQVGVIMTQKHVFIDVNFVVPTVALCGTHSHKGDALNRGNYRGLKLTEHMMKVMERIVDGMIREMIAIDEMQFAFVPGRGTTDAIFIIRQLQEKFLSRKDLNDKNLTLFFAFVDLEKAFDRVPRKVLWWAMRKVGVKEWIVRLVHAMYNNARSRVRVGSEYSEEFEVGVGVHQGSVLSPLLFIIVLEALSRDFRVGGALGAVLCRWSCDHCYFSWGMCWACQGVEGGIGIQGSSCKHD